MRLIVAVIALLSPGLIAAQQTPDTSAAQRGQFSKAFNALKNRKTAQAEQLIRGLEDYPLYVYFHYEKLRKGLDSAGPQTVQAFLDEFAGAYIAERLRSKYLVLLARRKQWSLFLDVYRPQTSVELRCHYLTARLENGRQAEIVEDAAALWTYGKSRPDACDPGFAHLETTARFDDPLIWQRFRLAMAQNNAALGRYLQKKFVGQDAKTWSQRWLDAHQNAGEAVRAKFVTADNPLARSIYFYALERLARRDLDGALRAWENYQSAVALDATDLARGHGIVSIAAAKADDPRAIALLGMVDETFADVTIETYRLTLALRQRAWPQIATWLRGQPNGFENRLRWRYWYARALEETKKNEASRLVYKELAKERDYYGYLAADRVRQPYRFNHDPIDPTPSDLEAVRQRLGLRRSRELFLLGLERESLREWTYDLAQMTVEEMEIAAKIAAGWGWHNLAIAALGKARSYDDIELRFPVLHRDAVEKHSRQRGLEPAVTYSIIRTESAFNSNARSGAGALGLMQLMPATGRETARRTGIRLNSSRQLLDPSTNISLGTSYLASLLKRYNNNFPMAAAGYNAGPHRVRKWRPREGCTPSEIWIELIPFRETRRYVRRTLFYYAVYQHRLGEENRALSDMLRGIPAAASSGGC